MKELNNNEMQAVSGAGFLSDFTGSLGNTLGSVVDTFMGGKSTFFADTCRKIGTSVAGVIESGFGLIGKIVGGLFGSKDQ